MTTENITVDDHGHDHAFLGPGHEANERRTWAVIWLCGAMMLAEIVGGLIFGSIALVADGLHMSTHAGALLLAALAYSYARRHAHDRRFSFGTGKLGDLAGFTSAIILAMIALLIAYEAAMRLISPVAIHFSQAIPIACVGLAVNVASVWLLGGANHDHGHSHSHSDDHADDHHAHESEAKRVEVEGGAFVLDVFEDGVPPRFRLKFEGTLASAVREVTVETVRPDGKHQLFAMAARGEFLESIDEIPEPHAFEVIVKLGPGAAHKLAFVEHEHHHGAHAHRDNNMQAAVIHVVADAAVSVLVIVGLVLARLFGWLWMDPLAGIVGACVIASWSYGLIRDTGAILLDMTPDGRLAETLRNAIETDGDKVADLHLWRLGPGHLGAILSVVSSSSDRGEDHYRSRLAKFPSLSHLTIEVRAP